MPALQGCVNETSHDTTDDCSTNPMLKAFVFERFNQILIGFETRNHKSPIMSGLNNDIGIHSRFHRTLIGSKRSKVVS
ncbi:hypothetical protein P3T22_006251 [Paraburkholderia sp. GAS348]